jgi:hypothetical protein
MPTVVNELVLEPKAAPPAEETRAAGSASGASVAETELERQVCEIERRHRERTLRLRAY